MNDMRKMTLLIALALLQAPAMGWAKSKKTAAPAETPVLTYRFEEQLGRVDHRVAKLLGDKQKDLRHMAEASVLADFCPAYQVDRERFKRDFDGLAAPVAGKPRKPVEQRDFENQLMTYFGVYVGLLVAEGAESHIEFCQLADSIRKNAGPVSRYWLAAAPAPAVTPAAQTVPTVKK
jgi:hypothetical protein